jgi:hypothetical protein
MVSLLQDASLLADLDGDLTERARVQMCVFHKDQNRELSIGFESMWGISDYLGFAFGEKAKEIWKPVMGFSIKQEREKPQFLERVGQYVLPFQTTRPPKKTTKGKAKT